MPDAAPIWVGVDVGGSAVKLGTVRADGERARRFGNTGLYHHKAECEGDGHTHDDDADLSRLEGCRFDESIDRGGGHEDCRDSDETRHGQRPERLGLSVSESMGSIRRTMRISDRVKRYRRGNEIDTAIRK